MSIDEALLKRCIVTETGERRRHTGMVNGINQANKQCVKVKPGLSRGDGAVGASVCRGGIQETDVDEPGYWHTRDTVPQ